MKLKDYLQKAKKEKWAIGQFNFSTLEQLKGILEAVLKANSPVILGTSEGESRFFGLEEAVALYKVFQKKYNLPIFLNLDHGKDLDYIKEAIDSGYQAVHFDGSNLSFKENIKIAKKISDYARKKNVLVEGELGAIRGESTIHKEETAVLKKEDLTSPFQVKEFLKKTGVDSLAIAIGTVHGIYLKEPEIDFERLKEINQVSKKFLVLHGGSGVSEEDLKKAINFGITKINFNTEIRLVWKNSLKKGLEETKELKPYKILPSVQNAISQKVLEKIIAIGSKNKV